MPKPPLIFWQPFGGAGSGSSAAGLSPADVGCPGEQGGDTGGATAGLGPNTAASRAALNFAASAKGCGNLSSLHATQVGSR